MFNLELINNKLINLELINLELFNLELFYFSSIPWRAVIATSLISFMIHIPFFLRYEIVGEQLEVTEFHQSELDLYYTTALMVVTRAIPILVVFVTNLLLLKTVNDAIKRKMSLSSQSQAQSNNYLNVSIYSYR